MRSAAFRRLDIDTRAQIGLGRFFAWKLRAGVLYALFARTQNARFRTAAADAYRRARSEYARVAEVTSGVYVKDVTYDPDWYQRGHWSDRIAAIDRDIEAVERGDTAGIVAATRAGETGAAGAATWPEAAPPVQRVSDDRVTDLIRLVLAPPERPTPDARSHSRTSCP